MPRIAALADLHGFLPPDPPNCDVIVLAGDICPDRYRRHTGATAQALWLSDTFWPWARRQHVPIVMTWGNHDWIGYDHPACAPFENTRLAVDESVIAAGLKFWCSPWTPPFCNWAFMKTEGQLASLYWHIPNDADVVVTHGPAMGHCDRSFDGKHCGSSALRIALNEVRPQLHLCGHIHEGRGSDFVRDCGTKTVNCTHVNLRYDPVYDWIVEDI